jgi:DNA polymerase III delta subunit
MYFLLYGDDAFRSRKRLAAMRGRFSATRDATGLNVSSFRAKGADMDEVLSSFYASPFLAERKMLVLDGFLRAPADGQDRLKDALGKKPESTVVIFYEDAGAEDLAKSPLFSILKSQKFTEECAKLAGAALERFVTEECAAAGVTAVPKIIRALIAVVGDDTWQLHEEIQKVCAYAQATGSAAVTEEMLATLTPGAREESFFALIDACVEGRCGDAAVMLERMLDAGTSELQVVSMLEKQYRTMIAVADFMERGERDKNVIAKRLGIHPFPAGKAMVAVRRHSPADLRVRYDELLEIERQMKTSAAKPNALLGLWLANSAA